MRHSTTHLAWFSLGLLALALALAAGLAACGGGGGGGGNTNPPPGPVFLAPLRYFPSPLGGVYTYRVTIITDPLFENFGVDYSYTIEPNPLGAGAYYNLDDADGFSRGPLFNGLSFAGLAEEQGGTTITRFRTGAGDQLDLLPPALIAVGQDWPFSVRLGPPGGTFLSRYTIEGTARIIGLQDVTLGGTTFSDCLRVDLDFAYAYLTDFLGGLTGSLFFAPDVGPVLGVCRLGGVEIGRVQLVALDLP